MPIASKRYHSAMIGAPTLSGTNGALIDVLDACLVNGFNSQSVSGATQSGGVATVTTSSAHNYAPLDVVAISGANEAVWNDEFRVLTASANSFTCAINASAPAATGTLTAKIAPLGWSRPFAGTHKAAYLPQAPYVQCYLRVQDDSAPPTSASGRWAKWRGYEALTDVDTGTGLFPTTGQSANGLSCHKSNASSADARAWWLAGDGGIFYFGTFWHASYSPHASGYAFGDINSLKAGDGYSSLILADPTDALYSYPGNNNFQSLGLAYTNTQPGRYLARTYSQFGGSVACGWMGDAGVSAYLGCVSSGQGLAYPHPPDNGLLFAPVAVVESSILRSRALPGLYQPLHVTPLAHLGLLTSVPDFPERTFQAFDLAYSNSNRAQCLIDTTGPWR